jgi:iron complex outermembrane receptor protein
VDSLTLPVNSAPALVLGAQPLKPETSRHISAGFVVTPVSEFDITVDYYHIAIDDRIVLSGNFTAAPIVALLAPFGANGARFFTNAINTRTQGADVTASYHVGMDAAGDLRLRAGYNHSETKIVGEIATPPQLAAYSSVLFDRIETRRMTCSQPQDSVRLGSDWRLHKLGVDLNLDRFGSFCSTTANIADDQTYGAKWLTDLEASYHMARYSFAIGAENLFNVFPDRNNTINSFNGIMTFPRNSPFGFNGRTIYARVGWGF